MDPVTAAVIVIALFALIVVAALVVFRDQIRVLIQGPGGTRLELEGANEPPPEKLSEEPSPEEPGDEAQLEGPAVQVDDAVSRGGGLRAEDQTGRGAGVRRIDVQGDITVSSSLPSDDRPPGEGPAKKAVLPDARPGASTAVEGVQAGGNVITVTGDYIVNQNVKPVQPGSAPPLPPLIIGREDAMGELKTRLGLKAGESGQVQVLTAVRGWPGVGKTTVAAALAHDAEVAASFPDGVLWVSLGPQPHLLSQLATWGRALGTDELLRAKTLEEAVAQLRALLRNKRMLLIVDDVWEPEHAAPFMVGGRGCATLVTTRAKEVAEALAPTPGQVYWLDILSDESAMELLTVLAPAVVKEHGDECLELVHELEGLPLALQVAGRLLNVEAGYGFGVTDLLAQLREGTALLEAEAPADRTELAQEATPTVAVLLAKSTDRLDPETRDRFAFLGPFAPKPSTFDLAALKAVWQIDDPKPTVRILVDRGLLEPVASGRLQMHALLVMHARFLLTEE